MDLKVLLLLMDFYKDMIYRVQTILSTLLELLVNKGMFSILTLYQSKEKWVHMDSKIKTRSNLILVFHQLRDHFECMEHRLYLILSLV